MLKRRFTSIVNKFKTKKWPWVTSGLVLVFIVAGIAGGGNTESSTDRQRVAAEKAEAKASKEAAKKDEKERKSREKKEKEEAEKQRKQQEGAQKEKEKEEAKKPEKQEAEEQPQPELARQSPGPEAEAEELRIQFFWDRWAWTGSRSFSSSCYQTIAEGYPEDWTCRAKSLGSFQKGGYEVYTDAVKGKRKSFERADADKLADSIIGGICTTVSGDDRAFDKVFILVRDSTGDNIKQRTCVNNGRGY